MNRPPLEVADLIRAAGDTFIERSRQWIRWKHVKVLLAIVRCRTAALGGHLDECTRCGYRAAISYNSCRNRHCPKCQANGHLLPNSECVQLPGICRSCQLLNGLRLLLRSAALLRRTTTPHLHSIQNA